VHPHDDCASEHVRMAPLLLDKVAPKKLLVLPVVPDDMVPRPCEQQMASCQFPSEKMGGMVSEDWFASNLTRNYGTKILRLLDIILRLSSHCDDRHKS
jgi:hypothetical protein